MNPNNGEILTMISLPAYDNNLFAKGISTADYAKLANDPAKPLFDRAISGEYPSGSTVKNGGGGRGSARKSYHWTHNRKFHRRLARQSIFFSRTG